MTERSQQLVDEYLRDLDAALVGLPRERRRELVAEISAHIAEAQAQIAAGDEAGLRDVFDRLGDPAEIARDARERAGVPERTHGWLEVAAVVLLLVGGFIAGVGWLVGVVLLWLSTAWTTGEKLIGTLVVPGGLALPVMLLGFAGTTSGQVCSGAGVAPGTTQTPQPTCTDVAGTPLSIQLLFGALVVVVFAAPIFTAVYLGRRRRSIVPA